MHDGIERDYILYVPVNYTGAASVPLVFNFHGYGSNANDQMWYGDFRSIADTTGFLIVHPQGTLLNGITHWNVGGWTIGSTADDVGFTDALIDSISSKYSIDSMRIYSTGMSNGGFMSFLLACQLSEKIAAIASVTGSMTPETFNNSNPQHPTPILQIHGTSDGVVPYNGASWTKSIDNVIQYWVGYNNCHTTPAITALPDIVVTDGSTVEHIVYDGGDNDVTVEHFKVTGGGHTWPGTIFGGAGSNYDINASVEIWKFFSRYDINGLIRTTGIEPWSENDSVHFELAQNYPNPFNPTTAIKYSINSAQHVKINVYNIKGQLVSELVNNNMAAGIYTVHFDAGHLTSGVYFYKITAGAFSQMRKMMVIK
ncbi:T9SS type A sorting domain-containing protein [bacterium]